MLKKKSHATWLTRCTERCSQEVPGTALLGQNFDPFLQQHLAFSLIFQVQISSLSFQGKTQLAYDLSHHLFSSIIAKLVTKTCLAHLHPSGAVIRACGVPVPPHADSGTPPGDVGWLLSHTGLGAKPGCCTSHQVPDFIEPL